MLDPKNMGTINPFLFADVSRVLPVDARPRSRMIKTTSNADQFDKLEASAGTRIGREPADPDVAAKAEATITLAMTTFNPTTSITNKWPGRNPAKALQVWPHQQIAGFQREPISKGPT